jgi:hypothetical protein
VRDDHDPTERELERTADRVRALAGERLPTEARDRHLLRIRTHEPASDAARRPTPAPGRGWRRRLAPLTAAATALVLFGGGGTVVAAQDATPDDTLYTVKRATEQVWVGMPRGRERAAEVQLALADRRLDEARRAPHHAQRLVEEGVANAEAAADERPEEAIESFLRLLGEGEGRLPAEASPRARQALHRNCVRIATKHQLGPERCGTAPDAGDHPGRGQGREQAPGQLGERGQGRDRAPGQLGERGQGRDGAPGQLGERQGRGWGPGGRPEGVEGPPWEADGGAKPGVGAGDDEPDEGTDPEG